MTSRVATSGKSSNGAVAILSVEGSLVQAAMASVFEADPVMASTLVSFPAIFLLLPYLFLAAIAAMTSVFEADPVMAPFHFPALLQPQSPEH